MAGEEVSLIEEEDIEDQIGASTGSNSKQFFSPQSLLILVACAFFALAVTVYAEWSKFNGDVIVGVKEGRFSGLVSIAKDNGYFEQQGITVSIVEFPTEEKVLEATRNGAVDIALIREYNVVQEFVPGETTIKILGAAEQFYANQFVVNGYTGITSFDRLAGKKIGVPDTPQTEYWAERTLESNGISLDEVEILPIKEKDMALKLKNASISAVVIEKPGNYAIRRTLDNKAFFWPADGNKEFNYLLLVGGQTFIQEDHEALSEFMYALKRAEDLIESNPELAKRSVITSLGEYAEYTEEIWRNSKYHLEFSQEILDTMNSEKNWFLEKGAIETAPENFIQYFDQSALDGVKPWGTTFGQEGDL